MIPRHDTSNIPDDPSYWSSLTDRVSRHALTHRQRVLPRISTTRGIWVAAACLLLVVAVGWMRERITNSDGVALGVPAAAPSISAALLAGRQ